MHLIIYEFNQTRLIICCLTAFKVPMYKVVFCGVFEQVYLVLNVHNR